MTDANLSQAVPKPAHIPDALVYDFDLFRDPALMADPHARMLDIARNAPPIFWTPRQGGRWTLAGHEAIFEASRDWEIFSNASMPPKELEARLAVLPPGMHFPQPIPINIDPPLHGKFRQPLNGAFSPKVMNALKDSIRALAKALIAGIAAKGRCEFMSEIAEPMPVQVFLKMLGLPLERQAEYRALVKEQLSSLDSDLASAAMALMNIAASMRPSLEERRDNPQNDIISLLWRSEIDGRPVSIEDMENYGVLLFVAGLDTVMNGMGFGVRHLAMDPALQAKLRAEPALIADAAEELLRRYTFTVPIRRVAKDVTFQGVVMKEDEQVDVLLPAADLDPRHFDHPERYDLNRENKVHIAFGAGPHRCLGSHLARIELQILYEELLAGLPQFRLDPAKTPRFHGGHVIGPDHLHLIWSA